MHMRDAKEFQLVHGGRQLSDMSTLELIDFSLEDDSLLPTTVSPPEDKSVASVVRLPPSVKNVKKAPGDRHISAGSQKAVINISCSAPKVHLEENAAPSDSALPSTVDVNCQGSSHLTKSEAGAKVLEILNSKVTMAKSEGKPLTKVVLTPTRAIASSWNDPGSKLAEGQQAKETGKLQENLVDGKENRSNQDHHQVGAKSAEIPGSNMPPRKTRSARAMHSLRKSLAWDKAFSTDEGILDGDELPLVAKTPKKPVVLPPLDLPDIMALVSPPTKPAPSPSVDAPKPDLDIKSSFALKPISDSSEQLLIAPSLGPSNTAKSTIDVGGKEVVYTIGKVNVPTVSGARQPTSQSSSSAITSPTDIKALSGIPRPVPVIQVIEDAVEKGTKLRLPGSLAHGHIDQSRGITTKKLEKGVEGPLKYELHAKGQKDPVVKLQKDMELAAQVKPMKDTLTLTRCRSTSSLIKPPSTSTSLSKKVSSVSKKVKDTLGRVLPGNMGGRSSASRKAIAETAHADRLRPVGNVPQTPPSSSSASSSSGVKVPGSPGPSYLTRSKSARAAAANLGAEVNSGTQKTGVFADVSDRNSSSNVHGKPPQAKTKSKGESIWGSLRGKAGSSSTKGFENVMQKTPICSSPRALKKTGGFEDETPHSSVHDLEELHSKATRDISSQSSKRSGLRLPSPKIGFFDAGRPAGAPEKPPVAVTDVWAKHGLPPRPPSQHGSSSARFAPPSTVDPLLAAVRGYLSSGIPNPPHVTRATVKSGRKGLVPSASAPASPRKNSEMLSPGTHQAVTGRYLTSRSNSTRMHILASPEPRKEASGAARKLSLEDNAQQTIQSAREAEEAGIKESFCESVGCEGELQKTEDVPLMKCSNQPAEIHPDSTSFDVMDTVAKSQVEVKKTYSNNGASSDTSPHTATGMAVTSQEERVEGKTTDDGCQVSSVSIYESEQSCTPDAISVPSLATDVIDSVLVEGSLSESKNGSMENIVSSFNNSPSIQSTFWNLQSPSRLRADDSIPSMNEISPTANDTSPENRKYLASEDGGVGGKADITDQVCDLRTPYDHHEKFNSEHASSSLGRDHSRRKSIFGWQEMHATLSSPLSDGARSEEQATKSQQSDMSVSPPFSQEKMKARASFDLSTNTPNLLVDKSLADDFSAEQVDNVRKQEPGQIMNGSYIDDMQAHSFEQRNAWDSSTQCWSSAEKREETSVVHPTKAPEKEILQSKLEDFFESHWSGWPVLEAGTSSTSTSRTPVVKGFLASATPDSRRGSDGAEHSLDGNSDSFKKTTTSDADTSFDGRKPPAVNRGLLNTAVEGSRLSITPPLKKERGLLALARSAVSRLTSSGGSSPRHESSKAIDRDGPGSGSFRKSRRNKSNTTTKPVDPSDNNEYGGSQSPFSEERIRALEAAVQEAILMKSTGAVQHSPPNKPQAPPNPWSPVKRPGQQPGPFDCTKKTAVNALGI
ncbi:hypothetical protein Mapa_011044 [Marchantia paleacea]|nr:hypothetical protein Mapa_011044 [Marchantia paleacea]